MLQASGKKKPASASAQPHGLWELDELESPTFTEDDENFLSLIADRIASQLQLLSHSGRSVCEVVDQQCVIMGIPTRAPRASTLNTISTWWVTAAAAC